MEGTKKKKKKQDLHKKNDLIEKFLFKKILKKN